MSEFEFSLHMAGAQMLILILKGALSPVQVFDDIDIE